MSDRLELIQRAFAAYMVERELGSGGMATVYLAHDKKHDRKVAIKILHAELAAVLGAERFLQEIRVTANLQHPHILGLIDSGVIGEDAGELKGRPYYVMPFVEGESLRQRLDKEQQLPVSDSVRIATEVASALDYAHRHNVVHRDIKPENILLHDGSAIVADFGIALAVTQAGGARMTQTGLSLGTPSYMSPEQAMGERTITARSDIYSLGAVTYEMLSGEPPFTGPTVQAIVARVMTEEPRPLTTQRRNVPPNVAAAVSHALEKVPADRFASAHEFAEALNNPSFTRPTSVTASHTSRGSTRSRVIRWAALAIVLVLGALATYALRPHTAPMIQFVINVPRGARFIEPAPAISPDGRSLAFIAADSSGSQFIWIRPLDRLAPYRLSGTEGARLPFWSPTSKTLGFFAGGKLKTISLGDASPRTICDAPRPWGGTWNGDDVIIFSPDLRQPLYGVSAQGGQPTPVTKLEGPTDLQQSPSFLADGKHFLFLVRTSAERSGIYLGSLGSFAITRLSPAIAVPAVSAENDLLIADERQLKAQRIDVSAARLTGPVRIVATDIPQSWLSFEAAPVVSVSRSGTLVYRAGAETRKNLVWMDRSGKTIETVASLGDYRAPTLSPDQSKIAVGHDGDIWVIDRGRANSATRLTFDPSNDVSPVWSPDGRQIVFASSRSGSAHLYVKSASGTGPEVELTEGVEPFDWSRDGRFLSFFRSEGENEEDIYLMSMTGTRRAVPLIATRFSEYEARFSPDSKWIVYGSEESGRPEVYVQTFPLSDLKVQISANGGVQPIWSRDGREIFFLGLDGKVMSTAVTIAPQFTSGVPRALFQTNSDILYTHNSFEPSADGQRFIVATYAGAEPPMLAIVLNWRQLLAPSAEP